MTRHDDPYQRGEISMQRTLDENGDQVQLMRSATCSTTGQTHLVGVLPFDRRELPRVLVLLAQEINSGSPPQPDARPKLRKKRCCDRASCGGSK